MDVEPMDIEDTEIEVVDENDIVYNTRKRFADFMKKLNLEDAIEDFIGNLSETNAILLRYGGRAWNKIHRSTRRMSAKDETSFLAGNYDIIGFTEGYDQAYVSKCEHEVAQLLSFIQGRFEELKTEETTSPKKPRYASPTSSSSSSSDSLHSILLEAAERASSHEPYYGVGSLKSKKKVGRTIRELPNYKITFVKEMVPCAHTVSYSINFHIKLEREGDEEVGGLLLPDADDRHIFYFELATTPFNLSLVNRYLKDSESSFVSETGLFFLTSLMEANRRKEKGTTVDEVREAWIFSRIDVITESFFHLFERGLKARCGAGQNFAPDVVTVVFSELFDNIYKLNDLPHSGEALKAKEYYGILQNNAFQKMFKKFPTVVTCDLNSTRRNQQVPYEEFLAIFDDMIMDSRSGGASTRGEIADEPSFRLLATSMCCSINNEFKKYLRIEGSGGDALRRYLYDDILHTADIDFKLFGTSKDLKKFRGTILLFTTFLTNYMAARSYFKLYYTGVITFGSNQINITFDSRRQENPLSTRFMTNFPVPLISIDVKIKMTITIGRTRINGNHRLAMLDISLRNILKKDLIEKQTTRTLVVSDPAFDPLSYSGFKIFNAEDNVEIDLTPIPTLEYLKKDVELMLEDELRIAVGKNDKDRRRLELIEAVQSGRKQNTINDPRVIENLEQIKPRSEEFLEAEYRFTSAIQEMCAVGEEEKNGAILLNENPTNDKVQNLITIMNASCPGIDPSFGLNIYLLASYLGEETGRKEKRSTPFGMQKTDRLLAEILERLTRNREKKEHNTRKKRGGKKLGKRTLKRIKKN